MRVIISGSSGLIGTALTNSLRADGHTVIPLVRREARREIESSWDPAAHQIDFDVIASADVVVNLAGASIGGKRLTDSYKRVVKQSRLDSTATIAGAIAAANPAVLLLQGSSMGYYGDRGTTRLTEDLPPGDGFLAEVSRDWEAAAAPAVEAGAKVAYLRTGLVLAGHGGFAERLIPLVKRSLLRSLGSSDALQSWISLDDEVRAMRLLMDKRHEGPANLVAPKPATMAQIIGALAHAFGSHRGFTVPSWALRVVVGEAADDLLSSQAGVPGALTSLDFEWSHPTLEAVARYVAEDAR
ncbi:TIGR01777 family oxidoreductase [Demequina sp. TTPB684]|uniref:TIGR01777 family oxidoreductase n=1 Tax=unclassified Demequina TaxID=2620311 RepID=UPI001CF448BA|nr:TIGR01777 family oxidoreductase [Demequina sp. TMPB413]MCB2411358.1 TIGR01777 family oxidoreductase [Demequina sp. TTPB684]UPU89123.1 TIGR01777 family oxidoreductase [Demequina sp. TMPB413]